MTFCAVGSLSLPLLLVVVVGSLVLLQGVLHPRDLLGERAEGLRGHLGMGQLMGHGAVVRHTTLRRTQQDEAP